MAVTMQEIETSKRFLISKGARRIILFGSALKAPDKARDLDIACEGIKPEEFYSVAGELTWMLRRDVDLIELSDNT
ncbi:MAG: DNA polymerase III subunit beta, partial [Candidatus Sumerlaeota bacterium]|nr:DNA polymerase III subunit beta [Candidatus Sumerlaeota bacterium]